MENEDSQKQTKTNRLKVTIPIVNEIEPLIRVIRGIQVILDRDLAVLYGVETRQLNQQVKRNIDRFPADFMFQLNDNEFDNWKSQFVISNSVQAMPQETSPRSITMGARKKPYAFTEGGVAMLSSVLRTPTAIEVNIRIMRAFIAMRRFVATNNLLFQRLETVEHHQLQLQKAITRHDQQIEEVFKLMESNDASPQQGIFYDGQIFDAYTFVSDLIRAAREKIVLIDNYVDDTVLRMLDKRKENVSAQIFTARISRELQLDLERHNAQYRPIRISTYRMAHDRFMIVDDSVYHIGASIKDLGRKLFGFSLMKDLSATELIDRIAASH